jgi:hypothetical protein
LFIRKKFWREPSNTGLVAKNPSWSKKQNLCASVSGWTVHDSYFFVALIERTAQNFDISEVATDKAYLGHWYMEVVEDVDGTPYISFKPNTAIPRDDSIWAKMNHLFMFDREEFMRHYHKRSYAESVCSMVKGRFDDSVWSKSDVGQINEV